MWGVCTTGKRMHNIRAYIPYCTLNMSVSYTILHTEYEYSIYGIRLYQDQAEVGTYPACVRCGSGIRTNNT